MTEFSAPFTTSSVATEYVWSRLARRWGLDGVIADSTAGTDLRVTGSGATTVSVAPGEAFVNGYYYSLDAAKAVNVTSNAGGTSTRIDYVVLRADPANDRVTTEYKAGGTTAPALTQIAAGVWEIPLAQCTVPAGATSVATAAVIDLRWFSSKGAVPSLPGARRPAVPGLLAVEGDDVLLGNTAGGWDLLGTAGQTGWQTYTPVWSTDHITSINWGTGSSMQNLGRFKLDGKSCTLYLQVGPSANITSSDNLYVTLPYPANAAYRSLFQVHLASGNSQGLWLGDAVVYPSNGTNRITGIWVSNGNSVIQQMTPDSPINFRSNDFLTISGTYEIA